MSGQATRTAYCPGCNRDRRVDEHGRCWQCFLPLEDDPTPLTSITLVPPPAKRKSNNRDQLAPLDVTPIPPEPPVTLNVDDDEPIETFRDRVGNEYPKNHDDAFPERPGPHKIGDQLDGGTVVGITPDGTPTISYPQPDEPDTHQQPASNDASRERAFPPAPEDAPGKATGAWCRQCDAREARWVRGRLAYRCEACAEAEREAMRSDLRRSDPPASESALATIGELVESIPEGHDEAVVASRLVELSPRPDESEWIDPPEVGYPGERFKPRALVLHTTGDLERFDAEAERQAGDLERRARRVRDASVALPPLARELDRAGAAMERAEKAYAAAVHAHDAALRDLCDAVGTSPEEITARDAVRGPLADA